MTQQTKAERSNAAKKAAATQQTNGAKTALTTSRTPLATQWMREKLGEAAVGTGRGRQGRIQTGRLLVSGTRCAAAFGPSRVFASSG